MEKNYNKKWESPLTGDEIKTIVYLELANSMKNIDFLNWLFNNFEIKEKIKE